MEREDEGAARHVMETGTRGRYLRLSTSALPPAVLLLATLVLFRDAFSGVTFYEKDTTVFYYPLALWAAEQLRQGHIPLWIDRIFGGYAILADGEVGLLYPLNLLVLPLLPTPAAFLFLRALHFFLGGIFMYAFLRVLRVAAPGSLVGGLVFAFGSFTTIQMHHENVVRSAIWLPLVLLLTELALRSQGWRRQQLLVGAGVALAMPMLGVHVQPVLMSLLALGLYVALRTVPSSAFQALWALALISGTALALASIQWVPLLELGFSSFRGRGVSYEFASAFAIAPANLLTLLFPYFFRDPDGAYWSLWAAWETLVYVGVAPLVLALLAILFVRSRATLYFALVATLGLVVAMANYSPLPVNVHQLLWSIPGFSSLRAPGRFSYLVVFGLAGLAALGMDRAGKGLRPGPPASFPAGLTPCTPAPSKIERGTGGAAHLVFLSLLALGTGGLLWVMLSWRSWLLQEPEAALGLIESTYLSIRHMSPDLTAEAVYRGLLFSLDLTNPKTALGLGLLVGTWLWLAMGRVVQVKGERLDVKGAGVRSLSPFTLHSSLLIALVAGDLVAFASDFHPRAPLSSLMDPSPAARWLAARPPDARVFADSTLASMEPNRLLYAGVRDLGGYSSLQYQRHYDLWTTIESNPNLLLDLWGARYYVTAAAPSPAREVHGVRFQLRRALLYGPAGGVGGAESFRVPEMGVDSIRLVSTLTHGTLVPQGTPVAEITLVGADGQQRVVAVRAGEHTAESAADRPDVRAVIRHQPPPVAFSYTEWLPDGTPYDSHLYYAEIGLEAPIRPVEVRVQVVAPSGEFRLHGLALAHSARGQVESIQTTQRSRFRLAYEDGEAVVYEDQAAFPRAFVVYEGVAPRPGELVLVQMLEKRFDPRHQVLLEKAEGLGLSPIGSAPASVDSWVDLPAAARVRDLSPERVLVEADMERAGFLVLTDTYHRGWRAFVDGQGSPIYPADYLFRAVRLSPGRHTVEFVFDPLSHRAGALVSLEALAFVLAVWVVIPAVRRRGRRLFLTRF